MERLDAARNTDEGRETLVAGGSDQLGDVGFAVDVVGSGLGLATHVVHGTGPGVEHLAVAQLEAELVVDFDGRRLARDLALETRPGLVQAAQRQLGAALLLLEDLDRLTQLVHLRLQADRVTTSH